MKDECPERSSGDPEPGNKSDLVVRPNKPYMVQCAGYRYVAVMDSDGNWRSYYGNQEIKSPVVALYEL